MVLDRGEGHMGSQYLPLGRYPLLEALLEQKGLRLPGIYTNRDAAPRN